MWVGTEDRLIQSRSACHAERRYQEQDGFEILQTVLHVFCMRHDSRKNFSEARVTGSQGHLDQRRWINALIQNTKYKQHMQNCAPLDSQAHPRLQIGIRSCRSWMTDKGPLGGTAHGGFAPN